MILLVFHQCTPFDTPQKVGSEAIDTLGKYNHYTTRMCGRLIAEWGDIITATSMYLTTTKGGDSYFSHNRSSRGLPAVRTSTPVSVIL